jgi:hypothetical protein
MFQRLQIMRESSTYQLILDEGRVEALRETILRQGRIRFGAPNEAIEAVVKGLSDAGRLRELTERLLGATSWDELLASP